jgi:hypothetical protein
MAEEFVKSSDEEKSLRELLDDYKGRPGQQGGSSPESGSPTLKERPWYKKTVLDLITGAIAVSNERAKAHAARIAQKEVLKQAAEQQRMAPPR